MVNQSLRILILEDNSADAELVQFELQEAGFNFTSKTVQLEKDFVRELQEYCPDLILSDYDLPQYNGSLALAEAKLRCPDTPFILITGAIVEDRAIEILTQGAKDYVLKPKLQQRLVPAVKRALAETAELKARKKAESELREAHAKLEIQVRERTSQLQEELDKRRKSDEALCKSKEQIQTILESITEIYMALDRNLCITEINSMVEKALGKSRAELIGKRFLEAFPQAEKGEIYRQYQLALKNGVPAHFEAVSSITGRWLEVHIYPLEEGLSVYFHDIDKRKRTEAALRESEKHYRQLAEDTPALICTFLPDSTLTYANPAYCEIFQKSTDDLVGHKFLDFLPDEETRENVRRRDLSLTPENPVNIYEHRVIVADGTGQYHWYRWTDRAFFNDNLEISHFQSIGQDITDRKQAEQRQYLLAEIMGILNDSSELVDAINSILAAIKRETEFDAVGMRLRIGDDFPYFAQTGFSNDFLLTENALTAREKDGVPCRDENGNLMLECTCGLVLSGLTYTANPLFTSGGSFWTNNTLPLLEVPDAQDSRLHPRNRCIHEGYLSVALIPIRANRQIVGLLQLNDRRIGRLTTEMIHFFEGISTSIGIALMRKQAEEALRTSEIEYHKLHQGMMEASGPGKRA